MASPTWVSSRDYWRQIITMLAIVSTFIINLWSNLFPLNGQNIGELSNTLFQDVLIIPANYAFIIWGVIYIGLFFFAAYQLRTDQANNPRFQRGGYWLVGACVAQNIWIFLFLLRYFVGSVVAMAAILVSLAVYYRRLDIGSEVPKKEFWRAQVPISLYMGWISVATIVNVAIALYSLDWGGWGLSPALWTVVMMGVAALISIWILLQRSDKAYPLVLVWALVAIALRHIEKPLIAAVALSLSLVLALFVLWQTSRGVQSSKNEQILSD